MYAKVGLSVLCPELLPLLHEVGEAAVVQVELPLLVDGHQVGGAVVHVVPERDMR